jgi:hypothetical protein
MKIMCLISAAASEVVKMRPAWTVAASVVLLFVLGSQAYANKACIAKATDALPHIGGLMIKRSQVRPVSPTVLATWKGQTKPIIVDVDVATQGVEETYSYICVITKGAAFVQRTRS